MIILIPFSFGDICQDFCTQQLGPHGCSRGSYCKNNYDCHGLFWTSAEQLSVCVYTGRDDECSNRFPVLCRDAASSLSAQSADMTCSPVTTGIPPTTSARNTTDPRRDIFSVPAGHLQSLLARDNVTSVKLYYLERMWGRSHPYVKLSFLNEGRNLGYYAVFDTGSDISYTFTETRDNLFNRSHTPWDPSNWIYDHGEPIIRAAQDGEAYRPNPSVVPRNPTILRYGVADAIRGFPSFGTIQENIRLFSGPSNFTFYEPRLFLVPPPGDRLRVLLGASRTSSFAAAAGAFAIIPSPYADTDIASNWQLLMGQNSTIYAQRYCRHDEEPIFEWFRAIAPHHFFAVEGLMWLQVPGSSSRQSGQRLEMIIDSGGTNQIWLTPVMMNVVVAEIESHGPRRIPSNGSYPRFENCTRSFIDAAEVSELRVMPGGPDSPYDESALSLRFPFRGSIDYHRSSQQCTLKWRIGALGESHNRLLIGTKILSKLVTVFDHTNQRVGFCRRSRTTPLL